MVFARKRYLDQLTASIGNGMIKVITGPRRSGKSYLLFTIFRDWLLRSGVQDDHILSLKLDQQSNARYRDLDEFVSFFKAQRKADGKPTYFLIDEIQLVAPKENPWVKGQFLTFYDALNEFLGWENIEVFVTGSNSHMLSSDIATEFRGRDWQIPMYPLSYSEIREQTDSSINDFSLWDLYWKYGGLPACVLESDESKKQQYLKQIYSTTYLKDIVEGYHLRDDIILENLVAYLASSVGSVLNPTNISNTFKSNLHMIVAPATIRRYIAYLNDAFVISDAQRFDLKGKAIINGSSKYFFNDMGLRNAAAHFLGQDQEPHFMENVIYNELVLRGFMVQVGSITNTENVKGKPTKVTREVDFVATKNGRKFYIQSVFLIDNPAKLQQEKESFRKIDDSFTRVIISKFTSGASYDEDGVLRLGLFDFLLNKSKIID